MPMAFFYSYPDVDPYPTTYVAHTYPEKGHHLRHIPVGYIAHKAHSIFHDSDHDVHLPKADVRETTRNFYVEVELPGVREKSELHLRWTTMRTLLLTSHLARPEIPESELEDLPTPPPNEAQQPLAPEPNGAAPADKSSESLPSPPTRSSTTTQQSQTSTTPTLPKKEAHLTLHERQVGEIVRAFNFPVDVDRDNTHAKLDAGLLKLVIPKLEHGKAELIHLPVTVHDDASNPQTV